MKIVLTLMLLACLCPQLHCQKLFAAVYENSVHLVDKVTYPNFVIQLENKTLELPKANAKVFLKDIPEYLPGYVDIQDESGVATEADDQNRSVSNSVYYRYHATVSANRDLVDPYIVFHWTREEENAAFIAAVPVDSIKADKQHTLTKEFYIPDKYKLIDPAIHIMCMGFEIGTSKTIEKPVTPYAYALKEAKKGNLQDGNIKPIRLIPTTPIKDADGNKRTGSAHLVMTIDDRGYVRDTEVKKCSEWVFAKAALMDAPFFLFCPKITDGNPVTTKVVVPFKF